MTHKNTRTGTTNQRRDRLFDIVSSYPVLFVFLLVFGVSVHVGAHTGVAGGAVDAADAVGGVLPPDAQVGLPVLLLLLAAVAPS